MTCLDKGRELWALYRANPSLGHAPFASAVKDAAPTLVKASVSRWPRSPHNDHLIEPDGDGIVRPWRVQFLDRGESAWRFRRFASWTEAQEFAVWSSLL